MDAGFIGLGNIGGSCAKHLIEAGHRVAVFDIDEGAAGRLVEAGAKGAQSAAAVAAASEAVLLSLPTPEASHAAVGGDGGVLSGARSGLVVVDLSTNSVGTARSLYERCRQVGVGYLDCPVSGGAWAAERGDFALMPSGDEAAFERVRDALVCFGKDDTAWLRPSGTGTLVKLINNQVFLVATQVFGEGYLLAAKAGLDIPRFLRVLRASSAGMYMPLADMIVKRQWEASSYDLSLAEKDLRLALESAAEIGTPLPLTEAAHDVLARPWLVDALAAAAVLLWAGSAAAPCSLSPVAGPARCCPPNPPSDSWSHSCSPRPKNQRPRTTVRGEPCHAPASQSWRERGREVRLDIQQ